MIVRISQHRFTLRLLLTLIASALPVLATAGDFDCGSDLEAPSYALCEFELDGTEELCGWSDLGTDDSTAQPTPATQEPNLTNDSSLDSSVAAVAAVALSSTGVSIEQIIEPFAMVGPYLDNSLETVEKFQRWWAVALDEAKTLRQASIDSEPLNVTDIQSDLDALAAQEPIDIEGFGPSVLTTVFPTNELARIDVTAIDALIGGSPIIATLEENYLPYDLSARDLKLWSVFPISTHPFCIRSRANNTDSDPMWRAFDRIVDSEPAPESDVTETHVAEADTDAYSFYGSADCHLDELVWQTENWIAEDSPLWAAIEPQNLGRQIASLATNGNRLAAGAAQLLAAHWPEEETQPSSAGAALLARAGAIEASESLTPIAAPRDIVPSAQIAEAPSVTNLR